jgi:hypothetical protein
VRWAAAAAAAAAACGRRERTQRRAVRVLVDVRVVPRISSRKHRQVKLPSPLELSSLISHAASGTPSLQDLIKLTEYGFLIIEERVSKRLKRGLTAAFVVTICQWHIRHQPTAAPLAAASTQLDPSLPPLPSPPLPSPPLPSPPLSTSGAN